MKVAYLAARFPFAFAEQFLEPEADALAARFELTCVAVRPDGPANRYPGLRAASLYLAPYAASTALLALRTVLRRPRAALAAAAAVALGPSPPRARLVNLAMLPAALAFAHRAESLGIEHVHANWLTTPATVAWVASRVTGVPFSLTAHQHDIFSGNLLAPKVRAAAFVRVISARNCRSLQAMLPEPLRARCEVVHLGVEPPPVAAPPAPARAARILCSARLCSWKGHRYLLAALARLRAAGVAFACDLAGDGELRAEVERLVARHGLGDRVRLLGNVPHAALVGRLAAGDYDVCALASTEDGGEHEGIPVALMEAMAAGVPVVATRTGSIAELVTDGESGLLVPQRDAAALADALGRLAREPELRASLGAGGRAAVLAGFATAPTAARLADRIVATTGARRAVLDAEGRKSYAMGRDGASASASDHVIVEET